jgi:hypothetical protein
MRFIVAFSLLLLSSSVQADIATEPWPQRVRVFPAELPATISHGGFRIAIHRPDDPDIHAGGGSGGPMLEFRVLRSRTGQTHTFYAQNVCAVLLEPRSGYPQLEIWGRGGGGYWTRGLYRFVSGEYRAVRYDEFEESPRHQNEKALTTKPPFAPHGTDDERGELLYFVETRIPTP